MSRRLYMSAALALGVGLTAAWDGAHAADTIKLAYIDPMSGAFANVGDLGAKHFQYMIDKINAEGGVAGGKKLELVVYDDKVNPQEALIAVQKAIDEGIRFITQGNGSSVAHAITDAVAKHNRRNPDQTVLYMNYAAVDPALTNEACNFWHFRFDADGDMKMEALTTYIAGRKDIKKVYLLNQDYSFGKALSAAANRMLKKKAPQIEIVGDEFHPLGKIKDFSPYITKIKSSGADAVITGNWGNDITLLIKAGGDAGLDVGWYTYYGGGLGAPTAMGESAVGKVKQITEWHENIPSPEMEKFAAAFEEKYGLDYYYLRVKTMMEMFAKALDQAGGPDPYKVALAFEGMRHETPFGEVYMRKDNHQLIQPLFVSTLSKDVKYDVENTGFGFKTDGRIEAKDTETETTCKMKRPKA